MTTREERLDELLALARDVGSLAEKAASAEHKADMVPKGDTGRRAQATEVMSGFAHVDPTLELETARRLLRELTAPAEDLATLPAERIRALFEAERLLRDHEPNLVARQARDIMMVELEQAMAIRNARAVAERDR